MRHNRVAVVQPTGTGKSFLYLKWIETHPQQNILVASPSHYISGQLNAYQAQAGVSFKNISYTTYAKLARQAEAPQEPFAETTAPTEGANATYQPETAVDFIILDEFHRCGAPEWGRGINTLLARHPNAQVLGTSATPIRYLDGCRDMAQEVFHDVYAVNMSIGEALAQKILPTPIYVASYYAFLGEVAALEHRANFLGNDRLKYQLSRKIQQAKHLLTEKDCSLQGIFQKHMANPAGKYIVFCSNEERLTEAMQACDTWFALAPTIHKYKVLSSNRASDAEFAQFTQDDDPTAMKLLFCIDMLNEGVHVLGGIDGVIMLRTTESLNVYYQQLGRALTCVKESEKRPIIFDLVNNFENGSAGAIGEELLYQIRGEVTQADGNIAFELHDYILDLRKALEDIRNTFLESWDYNFESVCTFANEQKRFPYHREIYHGIDLGAWCTLQRRQYQNGALPPDRAEKLAAIGFAWNPREEAWQNQYRALCAFVAQHKAFPKSTQDKPLYAWLKKQKAAKQSGQLAPERAALLDALGEDIAQNYIDTIWPSRIALLGAFIAQNQRLPQSTELYEGVNLGNWLVEQRHKGRCGALSVACKAELESLGVAFGDRKERAFWQNYTLLVAFCNEQNRFPLAGEQYNAFGLGAWCSRVRKDYLTGQLSTEQIEALQTIQFDLRTTQEIQKAEQWETAYQQVQQFLRENGRLPRSRENQNLYCWLKRQRAIQQKNMLSPEQTKRLQEIALVR